MNKVKTLLTGLVLIFLISCGPGKKTQVTEHKDHTEHTDHSDHPGHADHDDQKMASDFEWKVDRFADIQILRYQIPGFDQLTLKQKKYVYYLAEAGYAGRDIMYDLNYRHNLEIRRALETIVSKFHGKKSGDDWEHFLTYARQVWFASGIHHHYSMEKFKPQFSKNYFEILLAKADVSLSDEALSAIFDPSVDNKKVSLDASKDLVLNSAVNFYGPDVTQAEAEAYYAAKTKNDGATPLSHGLNTKLVRENGVITEKVWKLGGMYSSAIKEIIGWLGKAKDVAENEKQAKALGLLIEYYKTGDLKTWDDYNIAWVETTEGDIDYINSFIEVYNDPLGYKGSYESMIEINDFDASARMAVLADNIQWFEDNSPTLPAHKKKNVTGVSYKVINVAAESGDASPSTPIGVNLPNANWIRSQHGSKSVSLGNIIHAYDEAGGPGMLSEFAYDEDEIIRSKKYGGLADKMGTALHEVLGHASGQIVSGVGTPKQTLKNYASTLEEARADIFSLYYIMDNKLVEMGLFENLDAGKTEYDAYIRAGLMTQLRRLEVGKDIEESHMRNRQLIAAWAYEKGQADNVIEKISKNGKTYFNINDYNKLRDIFGQLLKEIQRIKSEGDYQAGRALVEDYGVKVDQTIHKEVLERSEKLNIAPYSGFVNPELRPIFDSYGNIKDIEIHQPTGFIDQMLDYGNRYSHLE